jgi:hypothetical protein
MYDINKKVRDGYQVSPKQPFGIYIDEFESTDFKMGGKRIDKSSICKFERGREDTKMRLVFENKNGTLEDIRDPENNPVKYGSQFARKLWIRIDLQAVKTASPAAASDPNWTFIEGRDSEPYPTDPETKKELTDWFATVILKKDPVPVTLHDLLEQLPPGTWAPFAVCDGPNMAQPEPKPRFVVICVPDLSRKELKAPYTEKKALHRLRDEAFTKQTLAIVSDEKINSQASILQCAAYDPSKGYFTWYDVRFPLQSRHSSALWLTCSINNSESEVSLNQNAEALAGIILATHTTPSLQIPKVWALGVAMLMDPSC